MLPGGGGGVALCRAAAARASASARAPKVRTLVRSGQGVHSHAGSLRSAARDGATTRCRSPPWRRTARAASRASGCALGRSWARAGGSTSAAAPPASRTATTPPSSRSASTTGPSRSPPSPPGPRRHHRRRRRLGRSLGPDHGQSAAAAAGAGTAVRGPHHCAAIVDSGTSLPAFPKDVVAALRRPSAPSPRQYATRSTCGDLAEFPNLVSRWAATTSRWRRTCTWPR